MSLDGKHVRLKCSSNTGSQYYNYKEYLNIVLLVMCDANYRFTTINVGSYGQSNDAGAFMKSFLGPKINNNQFPLPTASKQEETGSKNSLCYTWR